MEMKSFPSINLKATGKRIAQLRKERGLSVRDMQDYFGFDAPQAIYKWQSGTSLPSVDNLLALSMLLGVTIESILITTQPDPAAVTHDEPEGSVFLSFFGADGWSGIARVIREAPDCRITAGRIPFRPAAEALR